MLESPSQPENDDRSIFVRPSGSVICVNPLQLLRAYAGISSSHAKFMLYVFPSPDGPAVNRLGHPEKQYPPPKLETLEGMNTYLSSLQLVNACPPIEVTESGITMLVNDVHPQKAILSMLNRFYGKSMLERLSQSAKEYLPILVIVSGIERLCTFLHK